MSSVYQDLEQAMNEVTAKKVALDKATATVQAAAAAYDEAVKGVDDLHRKVQEAMAAAIPGRSVGGLSRIRSA